MTTHRVKVRRARIRPGEYSTGWVTYAFTSPDGMSGVLQSHPTHAAALAHALAEVGLTEKNTEKEN